MTRWVPGCGVVLAVIIGVAAPAASAAPALAPAVAQALLEQSGLAGQLADVEPTLEGELAAVPGGDAAQRARVRAAYRQVFAVDRLKRSALERLASAMTAPVAQSALDWLGAEPGHHFTALEAEAGRSEGFQQRAAEAESLFQHLPARRVQRYRRLARATLAGEGSSRVAIDLTLVMARGLAALEGQPGAARVAALREELERHQPAMAIAQEARFVTLFAGAYRSVDDRDLDRYIAFAESNAGTAYLRALIRVVDGVMSDAGQQLGGLLEAVPPAGQGRT